MSRVDSIIEHVEFERDFDPNSLMYHEGYGFLVQVGDSRLAVEGITRFFGFARPLSPDGGFNEAAVVTPIVDFDQVPLKNRNIDELGKGIGPRLYSVSESFGGARELPGEIGVYTVDLIEDNILDGRAAQGNVAARYLRHLGRMFESLRGVEPVVNRIHAGYENSHKGRDGLDAVELEVPPRPEQRRIDRGIGNPVGITPNMMIIRNADVPLRRVGTIFMYMP